MTADGLAGELPIGVILALCDRLMDEVGRRSHRFSWLRAPGKAADAWLPVEAYYPRSRMVVVCRSERTPYDHLFAQLVPEHGLRLLQFAPAELGADPGTAEKMLARMIVDSAPLQAVAPDRPVARQRAVAPQQPVAPHRPKPEQPAPQLRPPAPQQPAAPGLAGPRVRAPKRAPAPVSAPPRAPRPERPRRAPHLDQPATPVRGEVVAVSVLAGMLLAVICAGELFVAVLPVALDAGRVLLGFGLAFDACARALGTLDSGRAGKTGWAWASAIIGSPAVAAATIVWPRTRRPGRIGGPGAVPVEAAPLAGLISTLALVCVIVGLVA